jgi:hypothetical protein
MTIGIKARLLAPIRQLSRAGHSEVRRTRHPESAERAMSDRQDRDRAGRRIWSRLGPCPRNWGRWMHGLPAEGRA